MLSGLLLSYARKERKKMKRCGNIARSFEGAGFDIWDIFEETSVSNIITFEDNRIDKISSGIDYGIGVRGVKNGKTYYGYTNDILSLKDVINTVCSGPNKKNENISLARIEPRDINSVKIYP